MNFQNFDSALILQDGGIFYGYGFGAKAPTYAEICFTTSMSGYQHTITDPSFAAQIIVFTFPHIGNVGINILDNEREIIHAKGIVIRENIIETNHHHNAMNLIDWMKQYDIAGLYGVDTREIARHIINKGPQNGIIIHCDESTDLKETISGLNSMKYSDVDLVYHTRCNDTNVFNETGDKNIVVVDCGLKYGISRTLKDMNHRVVIEPLRKGCAQDILNHNPDGIVISNGPGDPERIMNYAKSEIIALIESGVPIFCICLGHQIMALSLGCKTKKMMNPHRGANHPVYDIALNRVIVTSQNHGYVIDQDTIPDNIEITHTSLFDKSIEGFKVKDMNIYSVQFHPEGSPGPDDAKYLFEEFIERLD